MSQDRLIKLRCGACKQINYYSEKNKKTTTTKIKISKFCKKCQKHTEHTEARK